MRKILAIFLFIFLISCAKNLNLISIDNGKNLIKINVEIADDNNEREKGLMLRESLDENSGMLFVFEKEEPQTFWMKNTLISLDIIFIDKNNKIIGIEKAEPCKQDPCALYRSSGPAKYILEVNAGFSAKNKISVGDKVILNQ